MKGVDNILFGGEVWGAGRAAAPPLKEN